MLAILGFIAVSHCSRVPENNDPVLGIWVSTELTSDESAKNVSTITNEEWIFNDVFLGRYHRYSENEIIYYTDFRWEVNDDDVYTISYSVEGMTSVQVSLKNESLELENGEVFATRK